MHKQVGFSPTPIPTYLFMLSFEGLPSAEAVQRKTPLQIASQYVWLQNLCCDWYLPNILTSRSLKLVGTANSGELPEYC